MVKRDKKYYLKYLLWYTLLFIITSAAVFYVFWHDGRSFCWTTDAVSQYVPKAYYFSKETRKLLTGIMHGTFPFRMFDFHIGMGEGTTLHLEPLYILYALFPPHRIEAAYCFVLFIRFYIAGLSASVFLFYFNCERWSAAIASLLYIYSGFGLFGCLRHAQFVVPMIMLPVLLISMEEIYRKQRWYLCTILVAVSFWCGYYFTYMNTIAMGIYFLIRFFTGDRKKSVMEFLLRMRTIICSYSLGIAIANITFVNTFADFLNSSRTSGTAVRETIPLTYKSGYIYKFFEAFLLPQNAPSDWMRLGFTAITYFAVVLLLVKKGRWALKSALMILTGCAFLPVVAFVFSGFSTVSNRWCYIYAFAMSVITAFMLPQLLNLNKKEAGLLFVGMLPYLYIGIGYYLFQMEWKKSRLIASIVLLVTYCLLIALNMLRKMPMPVKKITLTCLAACLLFVSGRFMYHGNYGNMGAEFTARGNVLRNITDTPLAAEDTIDDSEFYRNASGITKRDSQNASQILEYRGIVNYSSTPVKSTVDYYRLMGLTSWNMGRLFGLDNRGFLDAQASVKYYYMEKNDLYDLPYGFEKLTEAEKNGKIIEIFENRNALPFGYTFAKTIDAETLESYPVESRQEIMMQAAVVNQTDKNADVDLQITGKQLPITAIYGDENVVIEDHHIKAKKGSVLTLEFEGMDQAETYLSIKQLRADYDGKYFMQLNCGNTNTEYILYCDKNTYHTGQRDYVFNLGYRENAVSSCTITFTSKCNIDFDEITIYGQPMAALDEYTDKLREDVLEDVMINGDRITGTIDLGKDKLLVLSIPYQSGFTLLVDGQKAELQRVNYMYSGVNLTKGIHTIELTYQMAGYQYSLLISAAGVMILIMALLIRRKRKNASQHYHTML